MSRVRIVTMRFDLTDECDAATYQQLAESGRRAFRRGRGKQAHYLTSLMLGTRPYRGLELTGLTERPQFPPEFDEQLSHLEGKMKELKGRMTRRLLRKQRGAPVLRLVPTNDHNSPQQRARSR